MSKALTKLLSKDEDLRITENLVSIHAINPFINHCSSARGIMLSSHLSQSLVLNNGEERILQTGLEKQFGDNTFAKKPEEDVRIVKIIDRYNSIDYSGVDIVVEKLFIVESLETGEIDYINVPYYNKLHQYFGFKYKVDPELLESLKPGDILPKGTVLADSPTVGRNKAYKYGVNGNLALINLPDTTEDAVVISESFAEKLNYSIFETRTIEFGANSFPLNIYGDENNYKPFPDIGELINEDSVVMVLRDYDERLAPALTSTNDVKDFNPLFDKAVYMPGHGEDKEIKDPKTGKIRKVNFGRVVDIKVWSSPKSKKEVYTGTGEMFARYVEGLKRHYSEILKMYEELRTDKYRKNVKKEVNLSDRLHRLIIEAMAIVNPNNDNITYKNRNELLDLYRIEITVEYTHKIGIGGKISDSHGAKGVVAKIMKDEDMPTTLDGKTRADVIMDPASVVARLNVSRLYEQYFCAMSRKTQDLIRSAIGIKKPDKYTEQELKKGMDLLLGLLKILDNDQYTEYAKVKDIEIMREIIAECVHDEVYILFSVSNRKPAYQILLDVEGTIYEPVYEPVTYKVEGKTVISKHDVLIAPTYNILLNKVANRAISTSSSKLNHYGLPVSVSNSSKNRFPAKESSLKNISETEHRLFVSYAGQKAAAELKDRAVNLETHEAIYNNILNAEYPTNIVDVVDRDKHGYTGDAAMEWIYSIFNCAGISIDYVEDPENT